MAAGEDADSTRHQRLSWTPGFPRKTFIYIKYGTNGTLVDEKKTIYEYIYVYVKLGKKYFNQRIFFS